MSYDWAMDRLAADWDYAGGWGGHRGGAAWLLNAIYTAPSQPDASADHHPHRAPTYTYTAEHRDHEQPQ